MVQKIRNPNCPLTGTVNDRRHTLFPIKYQDMYDSYTGMFVKHWTLEEIDLSKDRASFKTMNDSEQFALKNVNGWFANADNIVIENLGKSLLRDITMPEGSLAIGWQMASEGVHVVFYNHTTDVIVEDPVEKEAMFAAIKTNPIVKPKMDWAKKWVDDGDNVSAALRLAVWASVEGILFAPSFAFMEWLRTRGKVPGIVQGNELILKDECRHVLLGGLCTKYCEDFDGDVPFLRDSEDDFPHLKDVIEKMKREHEENEFGIVNGGKLPKEIAYEIIGDAVRLEKQFVRAIFPEDLDGLNADDLCIYVECCADTVLTTLGFPPVYNVENPLEFMKTYGLLRVTSFFEAKVSEYQEPENETLINTCAIAFGDSDSDSE